MMSSFLEIKHFNQTTVNYAVERFVVLLNDSNRTDLSERIDLLYKEIVHALESAEIAKSNHEFRLNMLNASKQSKGLLNLIRFIKIYKVILVLDEDYKDFEELVNQIEQARRNTHRSTHTFKNID
ncbi:MAG: hypothetical protein ACTHJT_07555 [Cytophaga sp.]|uniref:hypothetical protein n=1 Tax=Cytophaga sp. TaxID=29535 RepID=UPI003F80E206